MNLQDQQSFLRSLMRLIRDLLSMGDLQLRLLSADLRETRVRAGRSLLIALISTCLLLGATPVILLGIAGLVHLITGIRMEYAWLTVGATTASASGFLLSHSLQKFLQATGTLTRSRDEFRANMEWIRRSLSRHTENE